MLASWLRAHPKRLCFPVVNSEVVMAELGKREGQLEAPSVCPLREEPLVTLAERAALPGMLSALAQEAEGMAAELSEMAAAGP